MSTQDLDAQIAEKVFGWRPLAGLSDRAADWPWFLDSDGHEVWGTQIPKFATDIAAAWKVLDKFHHYTVERQQDRTFKAYVAVHDPAEGLFYGSYGEAETAPMAICLAALQSRK